MNKQHIKDPDKNGNSNISQKDESSTKGKHDDKDKHSNKDSHKSTHNSVETQKSHEKTTEGDKNKGNKETGKERPEKNGKSK